jgi:hypothetical protein
MSPVISDLYLLLGGALGAFGRRWVNQTWRQRETVTDVAGSALATVLCVALGIIPDALRAVLTIDPIRTVALAAFLSAGAVGLVRSALGKYGFKAGETIAALALVLLATSTASAVDRGTVWTPGGISPQEDGANFAVLPISDTLTYLYTRVSTSPTQLRVYQSANSGQTVTLAQDAIVTGRATTLNPNAAMLLGNGQTLLAGFSPANVGSTPEAPWLRGTGTVWTTPTVTGLPTVGPTAAPFPSPFTSGFLRAVSLVASPNGTILSPVDNNSANPPVMCRSTDQGASFACVALPASIGTVRWRDPASGSTASAGSGQPLASPTPSRWLLMDSNAQVFRSIDDGLTWTLVTQLTTDATVSWAITCLPASSRCVALTSSTTALTNRLFLSTNAGDTWTAAYTIPRGDLLSTLVAAGGNTVLAVGDPSQRLPALFGVQSQDGGVTWFPIVAPGGWNGVTAIQALTPVNEWFSGAEELNTVLTTWDSGTPTYVTTNPRAVGPGHSWQSDTNGAMGAPFMRRMSKLTSCAASSTTCVLTTRFYFLMNSLACQGGGSGAQSIDLVNWSNGAALTMTEVAMHFTNTGASCTGRFIELRTDDVTSGGTTVIGTTNMALNAWYRVETTLVIQPGSWSSTLSLFNQDDLAPLETLSITRTPRANDSVGSTFIGNNVTGGRLHSFQWQLDDFGYRYAIGTNQPQLSGPAAVWTVAPTRDVAVQWSPQSGTSNFAMVNDVPGTPDDATSNNLSSTTNLVDRLGLSPLVGVPVNWGPFRAFVNFRATDGGTSAFSAARFWDSLGNTLTGATTAGGGYQTASLRTVPVHLPVTASNITIRDVNQWNIGYQGKIGGTQASVTAVWLNIEMQLNPTTGGGTSVTGPQPFWTDHQPTVRPDGSVIIWTFWSSILAGTTPSFLQAFTSAPTIPTVAGVPLTPTGTNYVLTAGASIANPKADVTLTTTATPILPPNQTRLRARCTNQGPDTVRIGDGTVTSTRGDDVLPGGTLVTYSVATVYAVAETSTATVTCLEDLP